MKAKISKRTAVIISLCVLACAVAVSIVTCRAQTPVLVLNNLNTDSCVNIPLSDLKSVTINGTQLISVRDFCERAGFSVAWDADRQAACVVLESGNADTPLKTHCNQLLTMEHTFTEAATNHAIISYIPINSCKVSTYYNYKDGDGKNINVEKIHKAPASAKINENNVVLVPLSSIADSFSLELDSDVMGKKYTLSIPSSENGEAKSASKNIAAATQTPFGRITGIANLPSAEQPNNQRTVFYAGEKAHNANSLIPDLKKSIAGGLINGNISSSLYTENSLYMPNSSNYSVNGKYTVGDYIGNFMITHYCDCAICNGSYGNNTAYGGKVRPGVTIAIDPTVIKKLSWVYIDGYGVRLGEDTGSAIKGRHIDMAVSDHNTANMMGVVYRDVWYATVEGGEAEYHRSNSSSSNSSKKSNKESDNKSDNDSDTESAGESKATATPSKTEIPTVAPIQEVKPEGNENNNN